MDFVIQHNMLSNGMLLEIREAVKDLPHRFVGLIPFSREITSDEPLEGLDHIPYGSTSFVETTHELGWKGLSFDVEKFSYKTAALERKDMLNGSGAILPASKMVDYLYHFRQGKEVFMRPAHDLKQFTGGIYTSEDAVDFLKDAMETASSGSYKIDKDCMIVVNKLQKILSETRWFIVGGQVIDGSMYRRNGELYKQHIVGGNWPAGEMVRDWLPDECCVMDTCVIEDDNGKIDTKVVEFNCINGSGFYDHDIKKIMTAWWEHHE